MNEIPRVAAFHLESVKSHRNTIEGYVFKYPMSPARAQNLHRESRRQTPTLVFRWNCDCIVCIFLTNYAPRFNPL